MMLYTKYESSGPCSFRQEDFWKWGTPRDHSCEVWSKSNEWFQRRRCLSKKSLRTTHDDRQSPVTIAHHEHFVLRWAKNYKIKTFNFWQMQNWGLTLRQGQLRNYELASDPAYCLTSRLKILIHSSRSMFSQTSLIRRLLWHQTVN